MSVPSVKLQDKSTGATARVLVGYGCNCYSFRIPHGGREIEVLWSEPGFESGQARPSGSGIPLLFPFPGRIAGTSFTWRGRTYSLEAGDGRGNAIHGFVLDRPWRVTSQSEQQVSAEIHASQDHPEILEHWPADFRIEVTYRLEGHTLHSRFTIDNPGADELPCALGTHPYFRLPLGGDAADACRVQLPVAAQWELQDMLATGRRTPLADPQRFQQGLEFGTMKFDDVFTDLQFEGESCTPAIIDPQSGVRVEMPFSRAFREIVAYTPPHREAVCVEPYTCVPGAFHQLDQFDTGWRILQPGESLQAEVAIRVRGL